MGEMGREGARAVVCGQGVGSTAQAWQGSGGRSRGCSGPKVYRTRSGSWGGLPLAAQGTSKSNVSRRAVRTSPRPVRRVPPLETLNPSTLEPIPPASSGWWPLCCLQFGSGRAQLDRTQHLSCLGAMPTRRSAFWATGDQVWGLLCGVCGAALGRLASPRPHAGLYGAGSQNLAIPWATWPPLPSQGLLSALLTPPSDRFGGFHR